MPRYLPLLVVACVSADPPRVEPEPVQVVPVVPAVAPKKEPPFTRIEAVSSSGLGTGICLHAASSKECLSLYFRKRLERGPYTPSTFVWTGHDMVLDRKPCKLLDETLSCEGKAPITFQSYSTAHYAFLRDGDRLWWYENWLDLDVNDLDKPRPLREMRAFPGGIKQLAVAFRTACAIAGDDSVWCWSDPRRPRRATVPAGTVEIFLQEPFELCARTASGQVSCSPATAVAELACNKRDGWCGQVPYRDDNGRTFPMRGRFDPLSAILKPQQRIELGHAAARIVRDDTEPHMYCDHGVNKLRIDPAATGGCALGPAGEVTCFAPCGTSWDPYRITGMPAVTELWVDEHTGYARTAGGTLYAWPNPKRERQYAACQPFADVAAKRLDDLPRVTQLTDRIGVVRGPHWYESVRCAISDGRARCWQVDDKTGLPVNIADPRTLPLSKRS